jgi:hypothetical protein
MFFCLAPFMIPGCQDQPLSALERARAALESASTAGALRYASIQYHDAERILQQGRLEMARQNGRLAPFRDYDRADSIYAAAFDAAVKAESDAKNFIRIQRDQADSCFEDLQRELTAWRESLDGSLNLFMAEHQWSVADMSLEMSERLILREEYAAAIEAVSRGKDALRRLRLVVADYVNDQADKLKIWRRWVRETLDNSRNGGGVALIVDKLSHKLYLVKDGALVKSFNCDLGYNSARGKFMSGDGATPEGLYQITRVRPTGSKYYKALNINYPNELDKKRFAENKTKGIIPRRAAIGALIEIHGEGGRNKDWTDGCVALTNSDLDHLMRYVTPGTPVTIVRKSDVWP